MSHLYIKRKILCGLLLLCILTGLFYSVGSHYANKKKTYKVLVIHSYSVNCPWNDELNRGIHDNFKKHGLNADLHTFYLDCERLLASQEIDTLTALMNRHDREKPDLIITCDDAATYSLLETRHPLTYSIPIVFCGVDYINDDSLLDHTNVTGFTTRPDFVQCYRLARKLLGEITEIFLIIEDSYLGKIYKQDAYRQLSVLPEIRLVTETTENTVITDEFPAPEGFTGDSVALSIKRVDKMSGMQMKWNLFSKPRQFAIIPKWNPFYTQLAGMGNIPFFAVNNEGMGDGRIGGYLVTAYKQTYEATERGIQIIQGTPLSELPVAPSKRGAVFDWKELKRWNINQALLPPGSHIIHMPFTERYKNSILVGSIAGCCTILFLIFFLMRLYTNELRNKKKAQKNLKKEQKELSITMESISEGVISIDPEEKILTLNQAAVKWLRLEGNEVEKYIGKSIWTLFNITSGDNPDYLRQLIETVRNTRITRIFNEDTYLITTRHDSFPISGGISIIHNNDRLFGKVITFRNITSEYTQREFLALSMLAGDVFAWRYDETTQRIVFDEAFFKSLELPDNNSHSFSREEYLRMIHPEDLKNWQKTLLSIENGKIAKATVQMRLNITGNAYTWWEYRITTLLKSSLEKQYKLFGICLNIQQFKETEKELVRFRDEALESDRKKGIFMANMSHEIRTPLNAIVGFSTLLTDNVNFKPEERKIFIETINENCVLLLNLINEILDISRIESGIQFRKECCDLNLLIQEIKVASEPFLNQQVFLVIQIPQKPVYLETDPLRLKQLLANLVNNAIKFTENGSITVGYELIQNNEIISFFVEDTGIGISKKEQARIFERFYKSNDFVQGGGLGLSICYEIVKRLQGSIYVESEEKKGTRFTIHIPYLQPDKNV